MTSKTKISRRDFLKLNGIISSMAAVSLACPAIAVAKTLPIHESAQFDDLTYVTPSIRFGTPTDIAATWSGSAWSVDNQGVIRMYDRKQGVWLADADAADLDADFPPRNQLVLARWGRPSGMNQMLMVLANS